MKKILFTVAGLLAIYISFGQNNFTIHGKIEMLSKSKNIVVAGPGSFKAPIREDGTFEITGKITEPGTALIFTDSSGANSIWLESGDYTLTCKEIILEGSTGRNFRIMSLQGPQNAMISHGFNEPRFYIRGDTPEETVKKHKDFSIHYIDSIFEVHPDAIVLPEMIRFTKGYIGDDAANEYRSRFTPEQKSNSSAQQLDYYFNRKDKIEKEKTFEDFSMKTADGKDFQLSSIAGKKIILIDFWSSDCAPCRRKHERLVELYTKYASKGLEIVSVSLDDTKADWLKAIEKDKMVWVNVSELKGWNTSLAEHYFVKSIPFSVLLNGERKIITQIPSEKQIEEALK
jgi:thiol-disulfide isomerase/thioredoxin